MHVLERESSVSVKIWGEISKFISLIIWILFNEIHVLISFIISSLRLKNVQDRYDGYKLVAIQPPFKIIVKSGINCLRFFCHFFFQTPSNAASSVKSLVNYLAPMTATDVEKVRAIYRWITANIR